MRGKVCMSGRFHRPSRDHPRLCGEKSQKQACESFNDRITPAYAGKSATLTFSNFSREDHPRLCGEKLSAQLCTSHRAGSPPPMRGKVFAFLKFRPPTRDHPRLCGEKSDTAHALHYTPGSPPPMRGKDDDRPTPEQPTRITPAYAGKSSDDCADCFFHKDHPRLCGEKLRHPDRRSEHTGSPPPMRGKGFQLRLHSYRHRITPAYAGKRNKSL